MLEQTMLRVPARLRDRIRRYGVKGQTYAEILANLMDEIDYRKFLREQLDLLDEAIDEKSSLRNLRDL